MVWNWGIVFLSNFSTSFRTSAIKSFDFSLVFGVFLVVSIETSVAIVCVSLVLSRLIVKKRIVLFANVSGKTFVSARNLQEQISDLVL